MRISAVSLLAAILLINNASADLVDEGTMRGQNRIVFPDGSIYIGGLKKGKKQGSGIFLWADGAEYRGGFMNGEAHGTGLYLYPDGRRKRVVHNNGRLIDARMLSNVVMMGGCVFGEYYRNGRYTGWYKGDRIQGYVPHGRGVMRYDNFSIYSGQWEEGIMHGNGIISWADGSSYAGQWVRGKRTGNGTYVWPGGDRYRGAWKDNQMCGPGTYFYRDGKVVTGIWKEAVIQASE